MAHQPLILLSAQAPFSVDVARLTLFLLSECSAPMTGAIIGHEQRAVGASD